MKQTNLAIRIEICPDCGKNIKINDAYNPPRVTSTTGKDHWRACIKTTRANNARQEKINARETFEQENPPLFEVVGGTVQIGGNMRADEKREGVLHVRFERKRIGNVREMDSGNVAERLPRKVGLLLSRNREKIGRSVSGY